MTSPKMVFPQRETTSVTEPIAPAPPSAPEPDAKSQSDEDREQKPPCYTVTVPLKLKKRHHSLLQEILDICRLVYNAANEERHGVRNRFLRYEWVPLKNRKTAKLKRVRRREPNPTEYGQQKQLTAIRAEDADVRNLSVAVVRGALKALAAAWKNVGKAIPNSGGRTVQPPRYKARHRDNVISWAYITGIRISGNYLITQDTGALRLDIDPKRPLPEGTPTAVKLVRDPDAGDSREGRGGRWFAKLSYPLQVEPRRRRGREMGVDVGCDVYAVDCDGPALRATRPGRAREQDRRREHRALATQKKKDGTPNREMSKKGSKRRRKAVKRMRRAETKVACQRRTRAAQAAARIVAKSDGVAVERAKNLAGLYRTPMAKSIYDAAWGVFRHALWWACLKAGIPLVEVPAAGTSQNCPQCGRWWAFDPKLSERWRDCGCGWSASRDVTSAYEVLRRATPEFRKRGGGTPWGRNVSTVGRVVPETPVRRKRPGAGARRRKAATESGQLDLPI